MWSKLDLWLGTKLIVPGVIKLCQTFNLTQHYFANVVTFFATLCMFYGGWSIVRDYDGGWFGWAFFVLLAVVLSLMTLFRLVVAAFYPEMRLSPDTAFWRKMCLVFVLLNTAFYPLTGFQQADVADLYFPLVFIAEWARLIDRIPPKEKKRAKARRLVPVKVRG